MMEWRQSTGRLPNGVVRAWHAVEAGQARAGIFEVIVGGQFVLAYHIAGERDARTERFPSFQMAKERAGVVLSNHQTVPRAFT